MSRLRSIPSVESLLQHPALAPLTARAPRPVVVAAVRETLAEVREALRKGAGPGVTPDELASRARDRAEAALRPSLRSVINATGIVLHTNLGRAPLGPAAARAVAESAAGYTSVEIDLATGRRGARGAFA